LHEKKRFCSNILFFAAPDAILKNFFAVNMSSNLSQNQTKITNHQQSAGAAMSQITVCFSQFFSRRLLKHFKLRSPWSHFL